MAEIKLLHRPGCQNITVVSASCQLANNSNHVKSVCIGTFSGLVFVFVGKRSKHFAQRLDNFSHHRWVIKMNMKCCSRQCLTQFNQSLEVIYGIISEKLPM